MIKENIMEQNSGMNTQDVADTHEGNNLFTKAGPNDSIN